MISIRQLDNMSLTRKLTGGFILVAILMSAVGFVGFFQMQSIHTEMNRMYTEDTVPMLEIANAEVSLNSIRALVFRTIAVPSEREADKERINSEIGNIDNIIESLKSNPMDSKEKTSFDLFTTQWNTYKSIVNQLLTLEEEGKDAEVLIALADGGTHANSRRATVDTFTNLKTLNLDQSRTNTENAGTDIQNSIYLMIIIAVGVFIISILLGVFLTRSITSPLSAVIHQFDRMSVGEISNRLQMSRTDEIGQMGGMFDRFCDFLEHDVIGTMKEIAKGNLSVTIQPRGDSDEISPGLISTINALSGVVSELDTMADRARHGDLTTRGEAEKFAGSYRDIVQGFNGTLEALIKPLNEAIRMAKAYAVCDFTAQFSSDVQTEGDFAAFRDAMDGIGTEISRALKVVENQMAELLEHSQKANSGIEDVKRGADLISKNADQTKNNAERSQEGIAQVLQAMEDLTRTVSAVSTNVEAVAQAGTEANRLAKTGILSAGKAESGMTSIRDSSGEVETIISEIQAQMGEISKITTMITDISEQTNLLALNAAIEAARAGEAGLGFAVVAGEVKELANQTGNSANRISEMIQGLEKRSKKAGEAMSGAGEAIVEGSTAMQETLESFNKLVTAVEDISTNMTSVAGATEEQAASFEEITASVNEMNTLVKDTAKDALNSSATAEEALAVVDQITTIINEINDVVSTTSDEMDRFTIRSS